MYRRRVLAAGAAAIGTRTLAGRSVGTTQSGYEPVGRVPVPGALDATVDRSAGVAYVAAGDGFAVVDLGTPTEPTVVAERRDIRTPDDQQLVDVRDVWVDGDRLVVPGPGGFSPTDPNGFALFDVSDPTTPQQVAFHETDHYIHNCALDDEIVYLTGSGLQDFPLVVVDVTDDDPTEIARWSLFDAAPAWVGVPAALRSLHDVTIRNDTACVPIWDAGTWLLDVSDPAAPTARGHVGGIPPETLTDLPDDESQLQATIPPGNDHYATLDETGTLLVVGRESWASASADGETGGPSGLTLYDVSDPSRPVERATIDAPAAFDQTRQGWFTTAHNFALRGDRLYASWYFGGVTVHDVSDPTDPIERAHWRDPRQTAFWTAEPLAVGETFVASSANVSQFFASPNETTEAVYVFPDTAGTQDQPPDLTARPTDLVGPAPGDSGPGASPGSGPNTPDDGQSAGESDDNNSSTDGAGPGFGLLAALGGVGTASLAAWRRLANDD